MVAFELESGDSGPDLTTDWPILAMLSQKQRLSNSFHTACVPRGPREEKEVFESVVTLAEMEVGPPKPPCRGRL